MDGESYLALWKRIRRRIEELDIEMVDQVGLDQITRLLERVQKGEMSLREDEVDSLVVVNIHIAGVCGTEAAELPR